MDGIFGDIWATCDEMAERRQKKPQSVRSDLVRVLGKKQLNHKSTKSTEITCFPGCRCIIAQESGAVKSEKSVEPRPGSSESLVNFCDSNVSLEMSRMKGRIS